MGDHVTKASEGTIRVLLADDDESFLVSLQGLIDEQRELSVVGTATDGLAAIELVAQGTRRPRCTAQPRIRAPTTSS